MELGITGNYISNDNIYSYITFVDGAEEYITPLQTQISLLVFGMKTRVIWVTDNLTRTGVGGLLPRAPHQLSYTQD